MNYHDNRPLQNWLRMCMNELKTDKLTICRSDVYSDDGELETKCGLYVVNPETGKPYSVLPILTYHVEKACDNSII